MSPPIRDGSGNSIGSIRLGDGSEISEVRTGAGDVLFSAIPDADLTQYALTDPDGRVTVQSATAYDASMPNGANETARLYDARDLDTFINTFDFNVSSYSNSAVVYIGFGNQSDKTLDGTNAIEAFVGFSVGPANSGYRIDPLTKDPSNAIDSTNAANNLTVGETYTIEVEYNTSNSSFTVSVFDNTDTLVGDATKGYDSGFTYSQHYAHMSGDRGFTVEGSIDYSITNHGFKSV